MLRVVKIGLPPLPPSRESPSSLKHLSSQGYLKIPQIGLRYYEINLPKILHNMCLLTLLPRAGSLEKRPPRRMLLCLME
ncbi:hypothetical protein A2U01_0024602 [Trifolium medium]|uniref:Uncharacterized protein n=1 Tax=Trifolium medium TaxID=97028 RepID=A0A392NVU0_9FABA|nr:hypothetical protein [Trifolium medium]